MKKQIFYACISLASLTAFSQEKEKKKMLDEQTQITYAVNTDSKKNGPYNVKDVPTKSLWLRGTYKNDERKGNWYTYSDKKMQMCYNYDQQKLLFIDSLILNKAEVKIITDDKEASEKARIPLLVCPVDLYLTLLCRNVVLPTTVFDKDGKAEVKIKAKISETGKATYAVIYPDGKDRAEQAIKIILPNEFDIQWIPASYQQKNLASEFSVSTILTNTQKADTFRRFRWNY